MSPPLAACRCGGRRFWHVTDSGITVLERRNRLLVDAAVQSLLCTDCHVASWFCAAGDGEGELDAFLGPRRACPGCKRESMAPTPYFVAGKPAEMRLVERGFDGEGVYQLVACRACRRADWYAARLESLSAAPVAGLPSVDSACLRCDGARGWQQIRLRYHDTLRLNVLAPGRDGRGHFDARVCKSCGHASLRAALDRPPAGASTLELPPDPAGSGPYR